MEERSVINKPMALTREEKNDFHKAKNINLLSQSFLTIPPTFH